MRKKSPRTISLDLLNQVEGTDRHPDRLLSDSFKRYRHLTPLDKAFLTELTYGVLRWRGKLDWIIGHFSNIPLEKIELGIVNVLRLGIYQILFLSRTPPSAAVNESAELAKRIRGKGGAGFVNAILRSILRQKEEIPYPNRGEDPALYISVTQSHPLWLVQRWIKEFDIEETMRICSANNRISPLTLRTNTLKLDRGNLIGKLQNRGLNPIPTPFSDDGILLKDSPPVSELPFFKEGFYIIQDEASQLVTSALDPKPGERILDACAAPGGKTSYIAQRMNNEGEIYALDVTREKLGFIERVGHQLGIKIVKTMKGDATSSLPIPGGLEFDRVLADVPCSGFGTIRRNPDLKWKKKEEDIRRLSEVQSSILKNLSKYIKKRGVLVYSTCTVFHEENEDVIKGFLDEHPEFQLDRMTEILQEKCHPLIRDGYLKTFPPSNEMDGFFVARMIKSSSY